MRGTFSDDNQADVIDAFNTPSRYLVDILNINNVCFDNMVSQIYPTELNLNKANTSDKEATFLDFTVPMRYFFCGSFMLFLSCFVMLPCTSVC